MAEKNGIAVIGDKDLILAFKAVGMSVFSANNAGEAEQVLRKIKRDYAVIFITESLAKDMADTLEEMKTQTFPAVIPIPGETGATGFGMQGIKKDIERAIGTDIFED